MEGERQITSRVLMVRPACFGFNPEAAETNAFQTPAPPGDPGVARLALAEFDALAAALEAAGVQVLSVPDTPEPRKPDAVFPNNWVSFHADGTVVLYPMQPPSRRPEVRREVVGDVEAAFGVVARRVLDLAAEAPPGRYLEGTGSLVLDRTQRVAYACRSPRTDLELLQRFAEELGYQIESFDALDRQGVPVYHTNVLMWIGPHLAGVCLSALSDDIARRGVRRRLEETGHEVLELDLEQMHRFAGNALALESAGGEPLILISAQAFQALGGMQQERLERHATLVVVALDTIECHGGGSARCMVAEVHLPSA
jgi:hypothetical protein